MFVYFVWLIFGGFCVAFLGVEGVFFCFFCVLFAACCFQIQCDLHLIPMKKEYNSACRHCKYLDNVSGKAVRNIQSNSGFLVPSVYFLHMNPFNNSSQI